VAMAGVFALVGCAIVLAGMRVGIHPLRPERVFVGVTVAGGAVGLLGALICAGWWIARLARGTRD
jgi:hypothetical protein